MQKPRPLAPPSLWLTLLIGWGPCVLANLIGVLTVLTQPPREQWFHVFVLLFYSLGAIPITLLLRALWLRQTPWRKSALILLVTSFVLALVTTALGYSFALRVGEFKGDFQWGYVLVGMQSFWFLLMGYCAMYLGIGYYLSTQQEHRRALAATALAKEAELKALRYQLHPHFLFNTLNAISTLVVEERTQDATRMIARLGDFLRATLDGGHTHEVALADELALTEHYLDIEKARLGDRLSIVIHVGPETLHATVPYLLLQPLVENAIRHGIAPRREGGRLEIEAALADGRLTIRLRNDGITGQPARALDSHSESSSVGLRNVRERLQHLYEDDHRFVIELADDGSCDVLIDLPYRRAADSSLEEVQAA
jgi:two-component system, LytTR family, sensor histidine kinase AlgZ